MNHVANPITRRSDGFTLIELMLAMTFIAVLLLTIALTIIQIATIYNKGVTLKEVNQSARSINDDITRTASSAVALNLTNDLRTNSAGGRLCFGNFSYIWNTTQALSANDANLNKYEGDPNREVHLVKVPDSAKIYCSIDSSNALAYQAIRAVDVSKAQELLPSGDHKLGLNQFSLPTNSVVADPTTNQSLYTLMFTIGSGKISAMNADQSACLGPDNLDSDLTYCTVEQFTIVLRTGNKVN